MTKSAHLHLKSKAAEKNNKTHSKTGIYGKTAPRLLHDRSKELQSDLNSNSESTNKIQTDTDSDEKAPPLMSGAAAKEDEVGDEKNSETTIKSQKQTTFIEKELPQPSENGQKDSKSNSKKPKPSELKQTGEVIKLKSKDEKNLKIIESKKTKKKGSVGSTVSYQTSSMSNSTFADSSSYQSSTTASGNVSYIKPPYIIDRASNISSLMISQDELTSSAYNVIAMKYGRNKETPGKAGWFSLHKQRPAFPLMESIVTPRSSSNVSEIGHVFPRRTHLECTEYRRKTPLAEKVSEFVGKTPEMYDSRVASEVYERSQIYAPKLQSRSFIRMSPHSEALQRLKEAGAQIPVLKTVSSARVSFAERGHDHSLTSNVLFLKRDPNQSSIKSSISQDDQRGRKSETPSKEDLSPILADIKVKITSDFEKSSYVGSKFNNFTANIVPGVQVKEKGKWAPAVHFTHKKHPRKTTETNYLFTLDALSQARQPFRDDCRSAFRNQRIPTLRRSPAYILCQKYTSMDSGFSTPTTKESSELTPSAKARVTETSALYMSDSVRGSIGDIYIVDKSLSQYMPCPRLVPCWKQGSFSHVRIDQLGIGAPRFYHWAPFNERLVQEIRCRIQKLAQRQLFLRKPLPFVEDESGDDLANSSSLLSL